MANLLKGRSASHNPSYEGYDLGHYTNFTSSVGHILPIHWDLLLPSDKVDISCYMKTILNQCTTASPITIREHVDYYFVPLEALYSLFPSLLSDTNEDAASSIFNKSSFRDGFPLLDLGSAKNDLAAELIEKDRYAFDSLVAGFNRLIEFFEYGGKIYNPANTPATSQNLNVLLMQAYHCVWQYFFRDDKRSEFRSDLFNFDKYYSTLVASYEDLYDNGFFGLEYRPLKKDPYTIVSPSPLGGQSSLNHFSADNNQNRFSSFVKQWLVDTENIVDPNVSNRTGFIGSQVGTVVDPATDVAFSNRTKEFDDRQSLQQHRIAQAIEKLSSIWMTSGKSYKDMMENLFGAKNIRTPLDKPIYIGSDMNEVVISPEIANVTTGSGSGDEFTPYTEAGTYVGRGYGENKPNSCKFTAPCHGILLALYSCVPDAIYRQDMLSIFNTYNKRNSFPNPLTDTLGEQPLFGYELNMFNKTNIANSSNIVGWLPRFHELKLKTNRAYGAFKLSLANWLPTIYYETQDRLTDWRSFYVNPSMLDNIMARTYQNYIDVDLLEESPYTYDFYESDPLLHFFRVNCRKASKMSAFGVPNTYFG